MKDESAPQVHHPGQAGNPGANAEQDFSLRALLRAIQPVLGDSVWNVVGDAAPLELAMPADVPQLTDALPLESEDRKVIVPSENTVIQAFLDGIQRTRVVAHVEGVPIVFATTAAVIRERIDRRMRTWRAPLSSRALYLPHASVGDVLWKQLEATGAPLVDSSGDVTGFAHPLEHRSRALTAVSIAREKQERSLAMEWVRDSAGWLLIDGGISGYRQLGQRDDALAANVVGVIKSHTTLYGSPSMLAATLRLQQGERSPLFLIRHRIRQPVVSWYLRLHGHHAGDPLHGLVRLELIAPSALHALAEGDTEAVKGRASELTPIADMLSASLLAERVPQSRPDARWDRLVYGIYDCERFLSALVGMR